MPLHIQNTLATLLMLSFVFLAGLGIGGAVTKDSMCECPMEGTPHQKIMRACFDGTGVRLSASEVGRLAADYAIETCSGNDCADNGRCECCIRKRCVCEREVD